MPELSQVAGAHSVPPRHWFDAVHCTHLPFEHIIGDLQSVGCSSVLLSQSLSTPSHFSSAGITEPAHVSDHVPFSQAAKPGMHAPVSTPQGLCSPWAHEQPLFGMPSQSSSVFAASQVSSTASTAPVHSDHSPAVQVSVPGTQMPIFIFGPHARGSIDSSICPSQSLSLLSHVSSTGAALSGHAPRDPPALIPPLDIPPDIAAAPDEFDPFDPPRPEVPVVPAVDELPEDAAAPPLDAPLPPFVLEARFPAPLAVPVVPALPERVPFPLCVPLPFVPADSPVWAPDICSAPPSPPVSSSVSSIQLPLTSLLLIGQSTFLQADSSTATTRQRSAQRTISSFMDSKPPHTFVDYVTSVFDGCKATRARLLALWHAWVHAQHVIREKLDPPQRGMRIVQVRTRG
jgi:hypothetical protein